MIQTTPTLHFGLFFKKKSDEEKRAKLSAEQITLLNTIEDLIKRPMDIKFDDKYGLNDEFFLDGKKYKCDPPYTPKDSSIFDKHDGYSLHPFDSSYPRFNKLNGDITYRQSESAPIIRVQGIVEKAYRKFEDKLYNLVQEKIRLLNEEDSIEQKKQKKIALKQGTAFDF